MWIQAVTRDRVEVLLNTDTISRMRLEMLHEPTGDRPAVLVIFTDAANNLLLSPSFSELRDMVMGGQRVVHRESFDTSKPKRDLAHDLRAIAGPHGPLPKLTVAPPVTLKPPRKRKTKRTIKHATDFDSDRDIGMGRDIHAAQRGNFH